MLALLSLAAVYVACLGGRQMSPAFGDGPSIYIVSALSLARGTGYRMINYPGAPHAQLYPIGYPLLLSFIFRALPFGPGSIFVARLLNVIAAIVWVEAARRFLLRAMSEPVAACAALVMGLAPLTVEMNGQIKADIVFGAILMVAMVVAVGGSPSDARWSQVLRGIAIGILSAAAMLVRTIGFTLVFGLALEMMLNRRWVRLLGFAGAVALLLGPFLVWSAVHRGGTFQAYASENLITWRTPISHAWLLASNTAPTLAFAPFGADAWQSNAILLRLSAVVVIFGLAITALVVVGWAALLRRFHVAALVIAPYMAIVFLWWFEPTRFVIPVLPLLVFCAGAGAKLIWPGRGVPVHRWATLAAGMGIAGAPIVDAVKFNHMRKYQDLNGAAHATEWKRISEGLSWVNENTPRDAVIFTSYPAGVYLFTARQTLDLNNVSHIDPVYVPSGSMDLDAQFRKAAPFHSAYALATYRWDFTNDFEWGLAPVERFVRDHPGRLRLQWATNDGHLEIFKLMPVEESREHS
jgi:hypothetical protein